MTVNKRSKFSRQRGSHTHGCGSKKKARGSGNRGGFGMAGTGKRADHKKPSIWKEDYFGKSGFRFKGEKEDIIFINVQYLDENADRLVSQGMAQKQGDAYQIDLSKLGANKLLGKGAVTKKLNITDKYASNSVIEKIKESGGEVNLIK